MPKAEITDLRVDPDGREGLRFTAVRKGEAHEFFISREALSDLDRSNPATEVELRAAFHAHQERIEQKVRTALDYQYRAPKNGWIALQTKDFQ